MRLDEGSFLQRSSHKFQVNSEKLVRGETPQLPITFHSFTSYQSLIVLSSSMSVFPK
jgi:hypothetical protein